MAAQQDAGERDASALPDREPAERATEVGVGQESGRTDLIEIPRAEHVGGRAVGIPVVLLGEEPDVGTRRDGERAGVGRELAGQHAQQRRLPGPVRAAQPQAPARGEPDRRVGRLGHATAYGDPGGLEQDRAARVRCIGRGERQRMRRSGPALASDRAASRRAPRGIGVRRADTREWLGTQPSPPAPARSRSSASARPSPSGRAASSHRRARGPRRCRAAAGS